MEKLGWFFFVMKSGPNLFQENFSWKWLHTEFCKFCWIFRAYYVFRCVYIYSSTYYELYIILLLFEKGNWRNIYSQVQNGYLAYYLLWKTLCIQTLHTFCILMVKRTGIFYRKNTPACITFYTIKYTSKVVQLCEIKMTGKVN